MSAEAYELDSAMRPADPRVGVGRPAPAPLVVLAKITEAEGEGVYNWTRFKRPGPLSGQATELNLSTGIPTDTIVVLHQAEGTWWFFYPITVCDDPGDPGP